MFAKPKPGLGCLKLRSLASTLWPSVSGPLIPSPVEPICAKNHYGRQLSPRQFFGDLISLQLSITLPKTWTRPLLVARPLVRVWSRRGALD